MHNTMTYTQTDRERTRLLLAQSMTARTEAMRLRAAARRITQAWERTACQIWQFGNHHDTEETK